MFGNRMKNCSVFVSLISPSKMILFEKEYQTFDPVFHHQMKHLEIRQKYSATRRIFNSLLGVSSHVWYITSNTRRSVSSDIQTRRSDITNTRRGVSSDIQTLRSNISNNNQSINQSTIDNQSDIQTLRSAMAKIGSNRIF